MGADAVRQAMVNRGDLDVGFEDSKSSLDIGEPLVARDGRSGTDGLAVMVWLWLEVRGAAPAVMPAAAVPPPTS
jgi:hypothetical protein